MSTPDANLALVRKWEETYNTDVERMVYECYAEDCEVSAMDLVTIRGHAKFAPVELQILQAAPRRYMKIVNAHPSGDVVTVQAVLYDPNRGAEAYLVLRRPYHRERPDCARSNLSRSDSLAGARQVAWRRRWRRLLR